MKDVLKNKVAIITGANQGFGLEIAKSYLRAGANVAICARNGSLLEEVASELNLLASHNQKILAVKADISDKTEVYDFVQTTLRAFGKIDILVNNAGIYGPKGIINEVDWDEWIRTIEINIFGSVLMVRAVLPGFIEQKHGKIIQLSGGGATNPLPRISAYAVSKAAIVRFIETLAEEVREYRIDVNALAPGALNTRMLDEILAVGPEKVGNAFYQRALKQKENGGAPISRGAELAVFLASSMSDGITGKLISAVWDPWESLPEHVEELNSSDIYTLRRIIPEDRGKTWKTD